METLAPPKLSYRPQQKLNMGLFEYASIHWRARGDLLKITHSLVSRPSGEAIIRLGRRRVMISRNPLTFKEVLIEKASLFRKNSITRKLSGVLGQGLITLDGDEYQSHRTAIHPPFLKRETKRFLATSSYAMPGEFLRVAAQFGERQNSMILALEEMVHEVLVGISMVSLFGGGNLLDTTRPGTVHAGDDAARALIRSTVAEFMRDQEQVWWRPWQAFAARRRLQTKRDELTKFVAELVQARKKAHFIGDDYLGILLGTQLQLGVESFSDQNLLDEAMTMLGASHETMANTLTWASYELAQRPEWQERLGRGNAEARSFAVAIFYESLRRYPTVWTLGREALQTVEVSSQELKQGDSIILPIWHLQHAPEAWQDPFRFDPERFEEGRGASKNPYFMPFGIGPRACIGQAIAMGQGPAFLLELARHFVLSPYEGRRYQPRFHIVMRPARHMLTRISRRNPREQIPA